MSARVFGLYRWFCPDCDQKSPEPGYSYEADAKDAAKEHDRARHGTGVRPAADWLDRSDFEAGRLGAVNARNQSRPIQANADNYPDEDAS